MRSYERLLSGDVATATRWARQAIDIGTQFDPAATAIGRVAEARCLILAGNVLDGLQALDEAGVAMLTGEIDPRRALRALRQRHNGLLCVTLGSRGSLLLAGDELHEAPAFRVDAVDTTGAGDVFRGALIAALLRGDSPAMMLRFASAAAAVSCTRDGAIAGVPNLQEISRLMAASSA